MRNQTRKWRRLSFVSISIAGFAGLLTAMPAAAQDVSDEAVVEEIVVLGSRIRRDEYSSAAPLQTFDIDAARKSGITTVSQLLQQSTIAYGQQIGRANSIQTLAIPMPVSPHRWAASVQPILRCAVSLQKGRSFC